MSQKKIKYLFIATAQPSLDYYFISSPLPLSSGFIQPNPILLPPTLSNRPSEFHACSEEACVGVEGYKGFEDEDRKQEVL